MNVELQKMKLVNGFPNAMNLCMHDYLQAKYTVCNDQKKKRIKMLSTCHTNRKFSYVCT